MIGRWVCRVLKEHIPEPAVDKEGRLYVKCRTCRKDLTP